MAQPIICDSPECAEQAQFMVTDLEAGHVNAFCAADFAAFCLSLAVESLGPEQVLATVGPIHVAQREEDEKGSRSKRRGKAKVEPAAAAAPEGEAAGQPEVEAAAPDG